MRIVFSILIIGSLAVLLYIFGPVLKEEIKYKLDRIASVEYKIGGEQLNSFEKVLTPPNQEFSIVIPKIAAVAPVFADVDPQNKRTYLVALKKGVAHAKGTPYPGEEGNTYLFAHSTDAFYNVGQYNAIFYLIGKLEAGDEIVVFYRGRQIKYEVYDKKVVSADSSQYLGEIGEGKTLTLQTCYPPGTAIKRLVVLAKSVID
jgi:sortase A